MSLLLRARRTRTALLAALLVAAAALILVLAIQAWAATVYHRETTEEVLRDYATLAADEAWRRVVAEVGYYGYGPAVESLKEAVARGGTSDGEELPDLKSLREAAPEQAARALALADEIFLFDPEDDSLVAAHPERFPTALAEKLARIETGQGSRFEVVELLADDSPATFVCSWVEEEATAAPQLVGFRVNQEVLQRRIAEVLESRALLPRSLGEGDLDNSVLSLQVRTGSGHTLYSSGSEYETALVTERKPPDDYDKVIEGLHIRAAIDPDAAHRLVIGGLPNSRLPFLLGLLGLTSGLLVASVLLIQRERALAQLRTDFVSRVSHELRTPLAQIRLFSETLRLGRVRSETERNHYHEILEREARRLTALVENVLQFSRAERDHLQLDLRHQAIAPILERIADEVSVTLSGASHTVEVDGEPGVFARVDPDAMHQALLNLVDNAIKYCPGGEIRLAATTKDGATRILVEDQGPGIPVADRDRVWQPFRRLDRSQETGTGIGLAVVQEIIHQHGGRCWIESNSPQGTRVVIELPGGDSPDTVEEKQDEAAGS